MLASIACAFNALLGQVARGTDADRALVPNSPQPPMRARAMEAPPGAYNRSFHLANSHCARHHSCLHAGRAPRTRPRPVSAPPRRARLRDVFARSALVVFECQSTAHPDNSGPADCDVKKGNTHRSCGLACAGKALSLECFPKP